MINEGEMYIVIDTHTNAVVYSTIYKNRNRARNFRDKKDFEYGAHRYIARLAK